MDDNLDYMGKRPSILIVEDHGGMRNSLKRWLSRIFTDHEVIDVLTGEEAIELSGTIKPELVLMDIKLPGINGIEAAKKIKTNTHDTKIIMMTIYDTPEFKGGAIEAGADAFISKNHLSTDLIPAMKALLVHPATRNN